MSLGEINLITRGRFSAKDQLNFEVVVSMDETNENKK
jgi:hypothetical protein